MTATLESTARQALGRARQAAAALQPVRLRSVGRVLRAGDGVALIGGLRAARLGELCRFEDGTPGRVLGLSSGMDGEGPGDEGVVEVVVLGSDAGVVEGGQVTASGTELSVPVGHALIGRVVDPLGYPLDGMGPLAVQRRLPLERPAPSIFERAPVRRPLHTGLKVIDALVPLGRGQRELIVGDRVTGKTAIALDTILAQRPGDVVSVYVAIGKRPSAIEKVLSVLRDRDALSRTIVVVTEASDPPGLIHAAPYAGASMAEALAEAGHDVLVVYDDLTRHAQTFRQVSLLLRRPPGREAYPGDVFHLHSRLLERATQLAPHRGGGSVTALAIAETQAGDLATYIPTNLISITDGQLVLSQKLFDRGHRPAIDVGLSVSRVGGKAQTPLMRELASTLKLRYAQYQELEMFSRFGTRLDADTRRRLEAGRIVRAALVQNEGEPRTASEEAALFLAVAEGRLSPFGAGRVAELEAELCKALAAAGLGDRPGRERLAFLVDDTLARQGGSREPGQ
ncbi:MAG: F0F1 ATP synthase subunit alpha [Planctomycetota bacterium]